MKAMVLAAGEGTRLRPLTKRVPKPMAEIVGEPLLSWTLSWLAEQGVQEAGVNLYHRPESIPDRYGDEYKGMQLHYYFEDELRGTSGGVKGAETLFKSDPFVVIYGDNLLQVDLRSLINFHSSHDGKATIGMFHHPNPTAAGIIATDENGRIERFVEKPSADNVFSDMANAGIYILDPAVLECIAEDRPSDFGKDIFPSLLSADIPIYGINIDGYLQDTGTPDSYRQANWDALSGLCGKKFANPKLWIGDNTNIAHDVEFVGRNIVGHGVTIESGCKLEDSIIWHAANIKSHAQLNNSIIGESVEIASHTSPPAGSIIA